MFEKYKFNVSNQIRNSKNSNALTLQDLIDNPENVLIVSSNIKNLKKIIERLNNFNLPIFNIHLIDLGTLEDDAQLFPLLTEMINTCKCKTFILQNEFLDIKYLFQAADISNLFMNMHVIHSSLHYVEYAFSGFNTKSFRTISNISTSGHQQHLSEGVTIKNSHFDNYRLGQLLGQPDVLNKPIKYADTVVVDLSVLKQADLPDKLPVGSSGITSESFNQIARSAGSSIKTRFTVLTGFEAMQSDNDISIDTISQFIYYFLSGANNSDGSASTTETTFIVGECLPYGSVSFTKNEMTLEWYTTYPNELPELLSHFKKIPCTYNDYVYSGKGELSPRLADIFIWLDQLSKQSL